MSTAFTNSEAMTETPRKIFHPRTFGSYASFPVWLLTWLQQSIQASTRRVQLVIDGAVIALSLLTAFYVRFDGHLSHAHLVQFLIWVPVLVVLRLLFFHKLGIYKLSWSYVCLTDAVVIAGSSLWVTGALLLLRWGYPESAPLAYWMRLPLGVIVPEYLMSFCGVLAIRGLCRILQEESDRATSAASIAGKRILLYGAGRAGVMLARELAGYGEFEVAGFIDDDPRKTGTAIAGISVLGTGDELRSLVRRNHIDEVVISIACESPKRMTRILTLCRQASVSTRIVPTAQEIVTGRVNISRVREVRMEDLLGRNTVEECEFDPCARGAYQGKRILVTGAGGSIGSELCRQLLLLRPAQLAFLDKDENSIFELDNELKMRDTAANIRPLIADIKLRERVQAVFREVRPQVVVHAAAHKHVPLMELHPCEAVLNNIVGLDHVLAAASAQGLDRFVFISSDKAVNPTNIMGATKRVGEKLLAVYSAYGTMRTASVRFGNVMGSRGSVIPHFQRQIQSGGPVTVTHPDMLRFFMTIPEAVQLVLRAGSLANQNETFVLNMGNPRRVLDLARQMIELAGLIPDKDIRIAFTGLRPGEKMEEELSIPGEALQDTRFENVLSILPIPFEATCFQHDVLNLVDAAWRGDRENVIEQLASMDLGYQPPQTHKQNAGANMTAAA